MFVLVLRVSRQQVYHPFSPSLSLSFFHSFLLSHSTLNHSMCSCSVSFFTFLPISPPSFLLVFIYNNYDLFPVQSYCFFFLSISFFTLLYHLSWKKKIKKDFVVATSKYNEMPSLPSNTILHKFVLHFKLIFFSFILDSTDFIPNRIIFCESSDNTIPVQKRRISKTQHRQDADTTELLVQVSVL